MATIRLLGRASLVGALMFAASGHAQGGDAPMVENLAPSKAPVIPSGLKLSCPEGPETSTASKTCPVIRWNGRSFWIFSFIDNRVSVAVVEYDKSGMPRMQMIKTGARYPWQVTVDVASKSLSIWGQANQNVQVEWSELLAPQSPVVVDVGASSAPARPSDLKVACMGDGNTLTGSAKCPVLYWGGYQYWAFSFNDNRTAMAVVAYDSAEHQVMRWDLTGARYVWNITVAGSTVTFFGQANSSVEATLNDLRSSAP